MDLFIPHTIAFRGHSKRKSDGVEDGWRMRLEWEENGLTDNPFHHVVVASRIAIRHILACGARRQRVRVQSLEGAIWCGLREFE